MRIVPNAPNNFTIHRFTFIIKRSGRIRSVVKLFESVVQLLIDHSPRSRNEGLGEAMRLLRMCDERGSGIDRVIRGVARFHLSPPNFLTDSIHTRVIIFARRQVETMDRQERIGACYHHACISYVDSLPMTNASAQKRFRIQEKSYPLASRIISDTIPAALSATL